MWRHKLLSFSFSLSRTSHQQLTASTWSSDKEWRTEREKRQPWIWRTSIFRFYSSCDNRCRHTYSAAARANCQKENSEGLLLPAAPIPNTFYGGNGQSGTQQSSGGCDCWPGLCDVTLAVQSSFHTHTHLCRRVLERLAGNETETF